MAQTSGGPPRIAIPALCPDRHKPTSNRRHAPLLSCQSPPAGVWCCQDNKLCTSNPAQRHRGSQAMYALRCNASAVCCGYFRSVSKGTRPHALPQAHARLPANRRRRARERTFCTNDPLSALESRCETDVPPRTRIRAERRILRSLTRGTSHPTRARRHELRRKPGRGSPGHGFRRAPANARAPAARAPALIRAREATMRHAMTSVSSDHPAILLTWRDASSGAYAEPRRVAPPAHGHRPRPWCRLRGKSSSRQAKWPRRTN